jgi:hypothetical protein
MKRNLVAFDLFGTLHGLTVWTEPTQALPARAAIEAKEGDAKACGGDGDRHTQ